MSAGRKKSGFQITSVTSDYDRGGNERRHDAKGPDGQEIIYPTDGDLDFKMLSFTSSPPNLNVSLPGARRGSAPEACRTRLWVATESALGSSREILSVTSCGVLATDNAAVLATGSTDPLVGSICTSCPSSYKSSSFTSTATTSDVVRPSLLLPTESMSPRVNSGIRGVTLTPPREHALSVTGTVLASMNKANEGLPKNGPTSSLRASPVTTPVSGSSRFRVVKLTPGLGEPYKKGRWTCVDFYDKDTENTTISKILDGVRHPHSLDSSGLARNQEQNLNHSPGLNIANAPGQHARSFGVVSHLITDLSSGSHRAQSSCDSGVSSRTGSPQPFGQPSQLMGLQSIDSAGAVSSGASSPMIVTNCDTSSLSMVECDSLASAGMKESRQHLHPDQQTLHISRCSSPALLPVGVNMVPVVIVEDMSLGSKLTKAADMLVLQSFDVDEMGRDSRSRSESPCPLSSSDSASIIGSQEMAGRNIPHLSLTKMMPDTGASHDSDDDSGSSSSSMIAIDNKIERAMDLVKSHLMYAVREEVEVLKEQIKELTERNALLEQENSLLRSLASPEQLSQVMTKTRSAGVSSTPQTGTTSA